MIVVATGTNGKPFDRLLRAVAALQTDEELVVQYGPSSIRCAGATCVETLPFRVYGELVARARVVVTHAGVGSILVALMGGARPVVAPRLSAHGEAVDDHQLELARRLESLGLATVVTDMADLRAAISRGSGESQVALAGGGPALAGDVGGFLREVLSKRRSVAGVRT